VLGELGGCVRQSHRRPASELFAFVEADFGFDPTCKRMELQLLIGHFGRERRPDCVDQLLTQRACLHGGRSCSFEQLIDHIGWSNRLAK